MYEGVVMERGYAQDGKRIESDYPLKRGPLEKEAMHIEWE